MKKTIIVSLLSAVLLLCTSTVNAGLRSNGIKSVTRPPASTTVAPTTADEAIWVYVNGADLPEDVKDVPEETKPPTK